jgi:hypothetical protein
VPPNRIAQRREEHVGAADDRADRADASMDQDRIAGLEAERPEVSPEAAPCCLTAQLVAPA